MGIRVLTLVICLFLMAGFSPAGRAASNPPMQLPPGMTQQMFKQLMTPGPPHPSGLPSDVAPYFGCIPTMGFHYVNPLHAPFGPVYGWYQGKVLFTEVMIPKTAFEQGKSWDDILKPLPGHTINHVDIWYEAHGHPGYMTPHYDIHAWYVPHKEHMTYCNN